MGLRKREAHADGRRELSSKPWPGKSCRSEAARCGYPEQFQTPPFRPGRCVFWVQGFLCYVAIPGAYLPVIYQSDKHVQRPHYWHGDNQRWSLYKQPDPFSKKSNRFFCKCCSLELLENWSALTTLSSLISSCASEGEVLGKLLKLFTYSTLETRAGSSDRSHHRICSIHPGWQIL